MTSHQFSASKYAAKYDFKRALKSTIVPTVATFLAAVYFFVISPLALFITYTALTGKFDLEEIGKNIVMCLTDQSYSGMFSGEMIGLIFMALGVLFALFSFAFIMKKRDVNVFFSSSIDRRTMFKNRVLACVLMMAAAILIPIIADIIMNVRFFPLNTGYIIKHALLIFAECYVYALTGFSLMLIAMSYCTTIVESIFFTGSVACAPTAVMYFVHSLGSAFLRGYNYAAFPRDYGYYFAQPSLLHQTSIINPVILGKAYGPDYAIDNNLINFGFHITKSSNEYSWYIGNENASFDYILPVIVWAVLSVCFIFIARHLFIRIKAENAGVHGKRPIATNFFAVEFIILLFAVWIAIYKSEISSSNIAFILGAGAVAMFIWYFIILAICKRTIKRKLKELIVPVATIGASLAVILILSTGGLGFSTYVPDPENVSKALITTSDTDFSLSEINNEYDNTYYYGNIFSNYSTGDVIGVFSDEEDLKELTEINATLTETTDNMTGNGICVYYELKNGRIVSRYYDTTDYDAQFNVLSLRDSKAGQEELTYLLTGDSKEPPITNRLKDSSINIETALNYEGEAVVSNVFKSGKVWVFDSNSIMTYKNIKNTPEFRKALLKDLLSQTYKQRFKPTEKPIGAVFFSQENYYDSNQSGDDYYVQDYVASYYGAGYYIYPSMTNTISYLKSTGEYELFTTEADEIESISIDTVKSLQNKQYGSWMDDSYITHQFRTRNQTYKDAADNATESDYIEYYLYNMTDYFKDGKTFTDPDQINELMDKSKIFYFSDNGDYIIMIKYKKAGYVTRLITADDVPSWAIAQKNA